MKLAAFILLSLVLFSQNQSLAQLPLSAKRKPNEDYKLKMYQAKLLSLHYKQTFGRRFDGPFFEQQSSNLMDDATSLKDFKVTDVHEWTSSENLEDVFKTLRDERVIKLNEEFPRRPTWLYPDDGCYARAEVLAAEIQSLNLPKPSKFFVFGNLNVKTKNSSSGSVTWWYHVVVAYRIAEQVFVIDPSIDPTKLLTLQEWLGHMGNADRMKVIACGSGAFSPDSECDDEEPMSMESASFQQRSFLSAEWDRLLRLDRNPEKELGEMPPWLLAN